MPQEGKSHSATYQVTSHVGGAPGTRTRSPHPGRFALAKWLPATRLLSQPGAPQEPTQAGSPTQESAGEGASLRGQTCPPILPVLSSGGLASSLRASVSPFVKWGWQWLPTWRIQ